MSKKKQPLSTTARERELLVQGLRNLLFVERESHVKVARTLYWIADSEGKPKLFDGEWKDLREWAATLPPQSTPLGLMGYDSLEQEANALIKKLEEG